MWCYLRISPKYRINEQFLPTLDPAQKLCRGDGYENLSPGQKPAGMVLMVKKCIRTTARKALPCGQPRGGAVGAGFIPARS